MRKIKPNYNVTINVECNDREMIALALEEISRKILQGFNSGFDENEDGSYKFETDYTEEEIEEDARYEALDIEYYVGHRLVTIYDNENEEYIYKKFIDYDPEEIIEMLEEEFENIDVSKLVEV